MTYSRPLWPTPLISAHPTVLELHHDREPGVLRPVPQLVLSHPLGRASQEEAHATFGPAMSLRLACLGWFPGESLLWCGEKVLSCLRESLATTVVQRNTTPSGTMKKKMRGRPRCPNFNRHATLGEARKVPVPDRKPSALAHAKTRRSRSPRSGPAPCARESATFSGRAGGRPRRGPGTLPPGQGSPCTARAPRGSR